MPPTPTVASMDMPAAGLSPKDTPLMPRLSIDIEAAVAAEVKVFVPRQRFILMTVQDKEVSLFYSSISFIYADSV